MPVGAVAANERPAEVGAVRPRSYRDVEIPPRRSGVSGHRFDGPPGSVRDGKTGPVLLPTAQSDVYGLVRRAVPLRMAVPLLVALGMRVLESLAAAQAQSVVIACVGAVGYLAAHAVNWPLVAVVGIPELVGVLLGWKIAHALPTRHLKNALIITLLALAPYLALRG